MGALAPLTSPTLLCHDNLVHHFLQQRGISGRRVRLHSMSTTQCNGRSCFSNSVPVRKGNSCVSLFCAKLIQFKIYSVSTKSNCALQVFALKLHFSQISQDKIWRDLISFAFVSLHVFAAKNSIFTVYLLSRYIFLCEDLWQNIVSES